MARPAQGQVVIRERKSGRSYALRFHAYGQRQFVTLGSSADGWTQARAEEEMRNADAASDPRARDVHLKLAHEYQVKRNIRTVKARADNDALGLVTSDDDRSASRGSDPQP